MDSHAVDKEQQRLEALKEYALLDTEPEQIYDDYTFLVSQICDVPMATISVIDKDRQWFKSRVGIDDTETPREVSFCHHTIQFDHTMIVEDALKDERFANSPLVTDTPNIRFYAGAPLITPDGHALGALCAIDSKPHKMTDVQQQALQALARQLMSQLTLRRTAFDMANALETIKIMRGAIPLCASCKSIRSDSGYWSSLEQYLSEHADLIITHGICPNCLKKEMAKADG